jgi:hypothetical protein
MKINWTRVILGGLLAGLIVNIFEFLVDGLLLRSEWDAGLKALNKTPGGIGAAVIFWLWGFLIGIFALWLYANFRPRFGGIRTAVLTGVAVWVPGGFLAMLPPIAMHLFRYRLMAFDMVLTLVEIVVGTVAGAWLYKDVEVPAGTSTVADPGRQTS